MRKGVLVALIVFGLSACTKTQVQPGASADLSLRTFLSQWEEAQKRFINGDPTFWKANSSHRDDVTIFGAFGGYGEKGWSQVGSRYDWASSQYGTGEATMKAEYLNITENGDLGITVAIERQEGARVGNQQSPARRALRVTQIFRKEDGAWKLLHRHADPLIEKRAPSTDQ